MSVAVNPPKTPVTKGSNGIAIATLPNICKMPGPPAPFIPTPLPNIGQSGKQPDGYSTTVTIEGAPVAIQGSSFGSSGDVASQGTGGGLISSNVEGPTTFLAPGSLDVQIEGKNVQILGDQMFNNCGPGGSPPNAATMAGVLQLMDPNVILGAELGVVAEMQEICDIHCDCVAAGTNTQNCIDQELFRRDTAAGYTRRTKSEVPYNMKTKPPSPYMSGNDPRRQTRNWRIGGSRRPDAVVVKDPSKPWSGKNIAALIECKWGDDDYNDGQRKAYDKIAGGPQKVVELNDENCKCPEDERKKVPDTVPVTSKQTDTTEEEDTTRERVGEVAGVLAGLAAVGLAIAYVAGAPVTVPATILVGATAACVGLLAPSSGTGQPDGA